MVIKIGTVFSGIGAIEQAFKRLDFNHEIEFACDNGNIDIDIDVDSELENIRNLNSIIDKRVAVEKIYEQNSRRKNFVYDSYTANYNVKNNNFFRDIKLFDGTDFENDIDLYAGGSPCQSFSVIGNKAGLDDARGTLFYDYVRVLSEIKPKVFIYENVMGLYNHDKGKTWFIIKEIFDSLGYFYKFKILNAKNYGIPQSRRRLFVIGFKDKESCEKFEFPEEKELNTTMQDFLVTNVSYGNFLSKNGVFVINKDNGDIVNEKYFLSEKLIKYCLSAGTKNFYHSDAKIDLPIARALLSTMGNHHRSSVNNYVTTNNRVRALTIEEVHRLMGFPDDYNIVVSKAQAYKQAGNSIVVDVLMELVKNIYKAMGWN